MAPLRGTEHQRSALRNWVKAFAAGKLDGREGQDTDAETDGVVRVQAEMIELRLELKIVRKQRRISRRMRYEIRLDQRASRGNTISV